MQAYDERRLEIARRSAKGRIELAPPLSDLHVPARSIALVVRDPLARRGLASALRLEGIAVEEVTGNQAPSGPVRTAGDAGLGAEVLAEVDVILWDDGAGAGDVEVPRPQGATPWIGLVADGARAKTLFARGFRGAVRRDADPGQLASALEAVARGLVVIDPAFGAAVLPGPEPVRDETLHLSPRETEVLELLAEGLSNKEIALELGLSPHTAKFHVTALLDKFGAETRTEAVVRAARAGLLTL